jgi:hypothetical protein
MNDELKKKIKLEWVHIIFLFYFSISLLDVDLRKNKILGFFCFPIYKVTMIS